MKKRRGRIDLTSAGGIGIGVGLVLMGQVLEGGALESVLQLDRRPHRVRRDVRGRVGQLHTR